MDVVIDAELDVEPENTVPIPTHGNFYHNLLACLDYPIDAPPVADLLRTYHGLEGEWLVVSPIHWQATHNDAMIVASGEALELSEYESRIWFAELAEFVALYNINLYYHSPHIWLLQCDGKPLITAKPVHTLHHQSMMPELKNLDETLFWQSFLTENQMFFNAHPLNKASIKTYPINGLWLWGAGKLHEPGDVPLICSDDSLLELARLLSVKVSIYQAVSSIAKNSVLLFNKLDELDYQALKLRLQKNVVRWFWSNVAYCSKPRSWWSRFRGHVRYDN